MLQYNLYQLYLLITLKITDYIYLIKKILIISDIDELWLNKTKIKTRAICFQNFVRQVSSFPKYITFVFLFFSQWKRTVWKPIRNNGSKVIK